MFRGGLVEGGAPFTKDVCYLDGLLRVTNFLRIALVKGQPRLRARCSSPASSRSRTCRCSTGCCARGWSASRATCRDWASDLSYLTAFMGYAAFLGECDLVAERRRYDDLIARAEDEMA